MILVFDSDQCLAIFPSIREAEKHLALVDIENQKCQICDEDGQIYSGEIIKYGGLRSDQISLKLMESWDKNLPLLLVEQAKDFSTFCPEITHKFDLKKYLLNKMNSKK